MEAGAPILAKVVQILSRTGPGGSCQYVKVTLLSNNRSLTRVVEGPLREGDVIELLEAERDQKVGRR
ncbi:small subunit ribosomal protein S28e [Nematocida displodere]|uniref:Small subunit ribosomal protein S28e n=1 Tax=Nematocida displodere TaxID=1805483 RepID=A0A177EC81_9MICR|nr:small subunit ribosomal protein S28e [Nematocida displodere]